LRITQFSAAIPILPRMNYLKVGSANSFLLGRERMDKTTKSSRPAGLDEFTNVIQQLAEKLRQRVVEQLLGRKWRLALLDVRYDKPGKSWLSKIRVTPPRGGTVSVHMNGDIQLTLEALNTMRRVLTRDKWYGLLMEIDSKGRCKTQLNYDPNCSKDQSFFDS
jgi:hypothetical protein